MAVAEASFNTEKESISFGLIEDNTPLEPVTPSFDIGKPSIIIKGSLEPLMEAPPRILIWDPEPGAPLVLTLTPAIRPLIKFSGVTILPFVKSF